MARHPGTVVLFGSGETSLDGQRAHEQVMREVAAPVRVGVLETPAGFELNSAQVAGRLAEFLQVHLQNYRPTVEVIPARRRGTPESPDRPEIVEPLYQANYLMMGPGSPTYAVRQLRDSLAWQIVLARHRLGHPLVLASAAAIAASAFTLPVYEIYKVGEDLHWAPGLDLFGPYGARLAILPHWNNTEGGDSLDTSHCFMGRPRFEVLREQLPEDVVIVGIDERTALLIDFQADTARTVGAGGALVQRGGEKVRLGPRDVIELARLGLTRRPEPAEGLPSEVWERAARADEVAEQPLAPPDEVQVLAEKRALARTHRDWAAADRLRDEIAARGWQVQDAPDGYRVIPSKDF